MKIKHVFFDLDHTLWDFETNSANAFAAMFKKHAIDVHLNNFLEVYKPINRYYWKLYREEKISKPDLRYRRFKEAFNEVNYTIEDTLIYKLAVDYIDLLPNYNYLLAGCIDVLDYLKSNYTMHIITNGFNEVQYKKLASASILNYFEQIITSESVNVKKPNPLIFNHALELSKAHASESIMIGDSFEADVQGALNVGMQAVYCDFYNISAEGDHFITINQLTELKQIL